MKMLEVEIKSTDEVQDIVAGRCILLKTRFITLAMQYDCEESGKVAPVGDSVYKVKHKRRRKHNDRPILETQKPKIEYLDQGKHPVQPRLPERLFGQRLVGRGYAG
jgi:hypothetical protein